MWTSLRDWGKLSKEEWARERNGEREIDLETIGGKSYQKKLKNLQMSTRECRGLRDDLIIGSNI